MLRTILIINDNEKYRNQMRVFIKPCEKRPRINVCLAVVIVRANISSHL